MINFKDVNLTLGNNQVLSNLNLSLNDGEIIGIIGPPSSGKSVLAKVLTGTTKNYKGDIFHNNNKILKYSSKEMFTNFSYLIHEMPANPDASLINFLLSSRIIYKKIFKPYLESDFLAVEYYIKKFELEEFKDHKIYQLSDSILKKAQLAYTFIREAQNIILDNPTILLDIKGRMQLSRVLSRYVMDGENIIIICSNDLNFISQTVDRVLFIDQGKIIQDGSVEIITSELIKKYYHSEVIISKNIYNGRPEVHFFPES